MILDILGGGAIVAIGLIIFFLRCSWPRRIWMLSHPLLIDVTVFAGLTILHWGTFTGVMVASAGSLICSIMLTFGRRLWGHETQLQRNGRQLRLYKRGIFNMAKRLGAQALPPPE